VRHRKLAARNAGFFAAVAILCACNTQPIEIIDADEIAPHRQFEMAPIRGADACVDNIGREVGYGAYVKLTLSVNRAGHPTLQAIDGRSNQLPNISSLECRQNIEAKIADWRYRPFKLNGRSVPAIIIEPVLVLPDERWRTPRRNFPEFENLSEVSITLRRYPGLIRCEGDRSASYQLELRGDGQVILTDFVRGKVEGGPLEVPGAIRHSQIDPDELVGLLNKFRAADFFSLEEEYYSGVTDQSGQSLTVRIGSVRAVVSESLGEVVGMPLVVRELQDAVDRAAGLEPFVCGPGDLFLRSNSGL
jgi:hypothetical protein